MSIWILILVINVESLGNGNSSAIAMHEFKSRERCEAAGRAAKQLVFNTGKKIEYVCTER